MLHQFMPCLPTRSMEAPSGERWVHEVKHDGYRLMARKAEGRVRLYSKQGYDWSKKYPLITEALYRLRIDSNAVAEILQREARARDGGTESLVRHRLS